ncbi:putative Zinc finger, GRF-type [Helianthus annuus]|nr:putative Zinc finger, GRF-type [Helianthus annuus]
MVMCWCGKEALLRTSWTCRNPGRHFYICPNQVANYVFFYWRDA